MNLFARRHAGEIALAVVIAVIFATGPPWWWHYLSRASAGSPPGKVAGSARPAASPTGKWTDLAASSWHPFGIAQIVPEAGGVMRVTFGRELTVADKWAGVVAGISRSCDYGIRMQAKVVSILGSQGGYGVGSGRFSPRSLPEGIAFQYDFGFGGYRALNYPDDWQQPYQYEGASLDHRWHEIYVLFKNGMTAYVDGRLVLSRSSPEVCGVPIIRVWTASVEIRGIQIESTAS